jgi:hypothetical protein
LAEVVEGQRFLSRVTDDYKGFPQELHCRGSARINADLLERGY